MNTQPGVVGIIGLGQMGGRMARVLHAAGWRVVAWDRFAPAVEAAARDGIETASDAASLADAAAIVITSHKWEHARSAGRERGSDRGLHSPDFEYLRHLSGIRRIGPSRPVSGSGEPVRAARQL